MDAQDSDHTHKENSIPRTGRKSWLPHPHQPGRWGAGPRRASLEGLWTHSQAPTQLEPPAAGMLVLPLVQLTEPGTVPR